MQNVWCNLLRGYLINIDDGIEPDPICDYLESMRWETEVLSLSVSIRYG